MEKTQTIQEIVDTEFQLVEVDVVNCANDKCYSEIASLKLELDTYQQKRDELSTHYHDMLIENLKRDGLIRKLESKLSVSYLNEFRIDLSEEAIDDLERVPNVPEKDTAFISRVVRDIYKDDLHRLKNKVYRINARNPSKTPLTPSKVDLVRRIFQKRITGKQSAERLEKFGKHVKTSLESINKKESNMN